MWTSPWIQRALWGLSGFALAALYFVLAAPQSGQAGEPAVATAIQQAEDVPVSDDTTVASQRCYLGVVLARDAVVVASETTGQLEEIRVRVGDQVAKDQLLATLDTRSTRHQLDMETASLRNAEAEKRRSDLAVLQAEEEEKRRQRLEGLISEEEVAAAKFQRQQAEAQRDAAEAAINRVQASIEQLELVLESSRIKAPFAGTVAQRYLDAGTLVNQGTPIVRLISDGGLLTRFAMPPEDARAVRIGSRIRIVIEDLGTHLAGVVEHMAPEIDAASQMLFAEASVETDPSITVPSGAMARVVVVDETLIGDEENAIVNCS